MFWNNNSSSPKFDLNSKERSFRKVSIRCHVTGICMVKNKIHNPATIDASNRGNLGHALRADLPVAPCSITLPHTARPSIDQDSALRTPVLQQFAFVVPTRKLVCKPTTKSAASSHAAW
ncbi:MAG: hypothetical protein ACNA7O_17955 [Rhodobacterales bacterium]